MRRITIVLSCALFVVATAAALLWAEDLHVRNQVTQTGGDLESARTDLQARLASAATNTKVVAQDRIALRLEYDPTVTAAVAGVTTTAADTACTQATDATKAGQDPPSVDAAVQQSTMGAVATYPVLSEVPGWQTRVDTAAIATKASECKRTAEAAKKESQKVSEPEKKKSKSPRQCPRSDPACTESDVGDYSCGDTRRVMEDARKGIPVNCYD